MPFTRTKTSQLYYGSFDFHKYFYIFSTFNQLFYMKDIYIKDTNQIASEFQHSCIKKAIVEFYCGVVRAPWLREA